MYLSVILYKINVFIVAVCIGMLDKLVRDQYVAYLNMYMEINEFRINCCIRYKQTVQNIPVVYRNLITSRPCIKYNLSVVYMYDCIRLCKQTCQTLRK